MTPKNRNWLIALIVAAVWALFVTTIANMRGVPW